MHQLKANKFLTAEWTGKWKVSQIIIHEIRYDPKAKQIWPTYVKGQCLLEDKYLAKHADFYYVPDKVAIKNARLSAEDTRRLSLIIDKFIKKTEYTTARDPMALQKISNILFEIGIGTLIGAMIWG